MTVTPDADVTLEHLVQYLKAGLNTLQPGCVAAERAFDDLSNDPNAYPLLIVHRTEEEGEALEDCRALIKYVLINQAERQKRPGLFRWMSLAIAQLLRLYEYHDPQMQITNLGSLRSRYRIGAAGNAVFPFVEIQIRFVDWNTDI